MSQRIKMVYNFEDYLISHIRRKYEEYQNINQPDPKSVYQRVELSTEQKREIDQYYLKHYGKKVPYIWHRYFYGFSGDFDVKYIPGPLVLAEYEWLVNPQGYATCIEDKNITPLLAGGIKDLATPCNVLSCAKGTFRDSEWHHIRENDARDLFRHCGKVFIKPTVDTGSGRGCAVVEMENGIDVTSGKSVDEIFKFYGNDFAVQECIKTHESIRNLYKGAVNTFRVVTYTLPDGRIFHTPTAMRIGQGGNVLDNTHAGGIFIGIDNEGFLNGNAYDDSHKMYFAHPDSNVVFKGYQIPLITKVHEKAMELHARVPQVGLVNWDFTINEQGQPTLIEANVRYGGGVQMSQEAWGRGAFEENTEEILEFLKEKRKKYPFNYR